MPKVSIVTTTYKHEKFIRHTIDSILNQSFIDWELLIWDDSPDDATWSIIQDYVQKYPEKIKAWHHFPNKWIVDNTNFLLNQMSEKTEFIAFLEGDDMYASDNLAQKLHIFNIHPSVQLVYSDLSFIDSKNSVILQSFFQYRGIPFFQNTSIPINTFIMMPAWPIASWSTGMIRRDMIEKYPIMARWEDKRYSIADYDFYFQVATANCVYGINMPLTKYRRHAWNLSGANGWTSWDLERWIDMMYRDGKISSYVYAWKKSWTSIVSAIFALEAKEKWRAYVALKNSFQFLFFYKIHYKICIIVFLLLPKFISAFLLQRIIKRWS